MYTIATFVILPELLLSNILTHPNMKNHLLIIGPALFLFIFIAIAGKAQVTEIYTDFNGYWKSTTTVLNATLPNKSHNVLGFTNGGTTYSTGVKDSILTANSVSFTAANFKALPITSIGGTINSGTATYIALGALYDGVTNGYSTPLPSLRMTDALTDGVNGLNIGTGVTNIPNTALLNFPVASLNTLFFSGNIPVILFSQTAQPSISHNDSLYFVNSLGVLVGSKVAVAWNAISLLGSYSCDLYTLSNTSCDAAVITGGFALTQTKDIRLIALKFSDFGITVLNSAFVSILILKPGGDSDPAFIAYNSDAFTVISPVILTQPLSAIICPATSQNVTFLVTALLATAYQWKKNGVAITGATSASYTITNVVASDAGRYEVDVSNSGGTVTSSIAYLNVAITTQPFATTAVIATGNSDTLSMTSTNATGFQWKKNGTNISGATSTVYVINPVTTASSGSYTVSVINTANSGCATILSNATVITADTILYLKSTGNLSAATSWGVVSDGTGSSPLDFTRTEHIFNVTNQASAATGANLTIAGTLDVVNATTVITPGTTLNAARIIRSGTGTLAGSATSGLTVNGISSLNFTSGSQVLKNLIIAGGTATLNTNLDITAGSSAGSLTVSGGTFNTSDSLTLKSDVNGTAIIGSSAGIISGKITVERYMPARRAWRLMTAPVSASSAPTINAAWQEGATSSANDPKPGFGTSISGGTLANGFDQTPNNASSLKYFNGTSIVPVANTNSLLVTQYPGYFFFIRGNRAYNILATTQYATALTTTIRVKGNVNQGSQSAKVIAATGYTLLGNPYASPIDFALVHAAGTNVKNRFWMWDPQLGGTNGVGAYVLLDWNGTVYTTTPTASVTGIIQAEQAFFVQSNDGINPGSIVVNESHKNITTSSIPFGRVAGVNNDATITADILIINTDSSSSVADGILAHYNDANNNNIDNDDALKFYNNNENLSIAGPGKALSIERSKVPAAGDTLKLTLTGIKNNSYRLDISLANFLVTLLQPVLYDRYLGTTTYIKDSIKYLFSITADASSAAADRFGIIFKEVKILPVKFLAENAHALTKSSIAVNWKVDAEINVIRYEVQRSDEADSFKTIGIVAAKNVNSSMIYQYNDTGLSTYNNFYRIKEIDANGQVTYSNIINVQLKKPAGYITVKTNPVTTGNITLEMQNKATGIYTYFIVNNAGQLVSTGIINHTLMQTIEHVKLTKKLAGGSYTFSIKQHSTFYTTQLIIRNQ